MENKGIEPRKSRAEVMRKRRKRSLGILLFLLACIAIVIALFTLPVFRVSEVYFVGNVQLANEELLAEANIPAGKNIFSVNLSKVEDKLLENPYIGEVDASREFPNKIQIQIAEKLVASYLYYEDKLVMCDLSGKVLDIIDDPVTVEEMTKNLPVSLDEEADKLNATPEPEEEEDEELEESEEDEEIEETPTPEASPEASPEATEAPVEDKIYTLPIVYGATIGKPSVDHTLKNKNGGNLDILLSALNDLSNVDLLSMVTKIDISDLSDVKIWVENRLELCVGDLDDFGYKSRFAATVIKESISDYEKAIMDFRGEKLYVRAPGSLTVKATPEPEEEIEEEEETATPEPEEDAYRDYGSMSL